MTRQEMRSIVVGQRIKSVELEQEPDTLGHRDAFDVTSIFLENGVELSIDEPVWVTTGKRRRT